MLTTLIATMLLLQEAPAAPAPPTATSAPAAVQVAQADGPADAAEAAEEAAPSAPAEKRICRRSSAQRGVSLVTKSTKVCRTAAEWKAAARR